MFLKLPAEYSVLLHLLLLVRYVNHLPTRHRSSHPLNQQLQLLVPSECPAAPPSCHYRHLLVLQSRPVETSHSFANFPSNCLLWILVVVRRMLGKINRIDGHHYRLVISLQLNYPLNGNVLEIVRIASVVAESSCPVNNYSLLVVKGLA